MTRSDAWAEAFEGIQRELDSAPPGSSVFLEVRSDRREVRVSGGHQASITHQAGLSVVWAGNPPRRGYLADPGPRDALEFARSALRGGMSPPKPADESADAWAEVDISPLEPQFSGYDLPFRLTSVAMRQRIRVLRPQRPAVDDDRSGERHRLEVTRDGVIARYDRFPGSGEIGRAITHRANARTVATGPGRAVLAPGVGGVVIHELIGHAREEARAWTDDRRVRGVLPFDVIDDPRRGRVPWRVDDEGNEARPAALVSGGRVRGRLLDERTAARSGARSNGHGRRATFRDPVLPRMGCTFLAAGSDDAVDLVRGTTRGVYVRRLEAASLDALAGVATFRVTDADQIEQGRKTYALRPFLMTIRGVDLFESIEGIANDLEFDTCVGSCVRLGQPLPTSVGAPTIRLGMTSLLSGKI